MDPQIAVAMARRLMREHGIDGWTVRLDRAKTRAGVCRFGIRQIGLSAPLTRLHSEEEVRDTILHEIAHALVGPEHGHDATWRAQALAIGSTGERCVTEDAPRLQGDWVGTCPAGHVVHRHRRPQRVRSCSRCTPGRFDPAVILEWTLRGRPAPMLPAYRRELEAIRVHYAAARGASAPSRVAGPTIATLELSVLPPPMPSICSGWPDPMISTSRASRCAGSLGRSLRRKNGPFEVPPRIMTQGMRI